MKIYLYLFTKTVIISYWTSMKAAFRKKKESTQNCELPAYKEDGGHVQWKLSAGELWKIHVALSEVSWDHKLQAEAGYGRPGRGGRKRELLVKGQGVRKAGILELSTGGSNEPSIPLLHHLDMFNVKREVHLIITF